MIYGQVSTWQQDKGKYPAIFDGAFAFLAEHDAATLELGNYPINGDALYASVQTPRTEDESLRRFEVHAQYADIQVLLRGREKQLYVPDLTGASVTEDLLAARDVAFYSRPEKYSAFLLEAGHYAVYFPGELHCPNCAAPSGPEDLRKVVFKVRWPQ